MRELAKDPQLKNESWDRFLPKFVNKNISKRKQPKKKKIKKPYTPFPPPQPESKVDKLLASGEYFLKEEKRKQIKTEMRKRKHEEADKARQERRNKAFEPPDESFSPDKPSTSNNIDIHEFKQKIKKAQKKKQKLSDPN